MSLFDGRLYLREAELIVGPKVTFTNAPVEPVDARNFKKRIAFNVVKTSESAPNKAKITIYNISQESRNFLEDDDLVVFLKAGYKDGVGTIFFGDVVRMESQRNGPDILTMLECGDSEKILLTAHIDIGLGAGATNIQALNLAAAKLNLTLGPIQGVKTINYLNGFTFSGLAKDLLDQIAKQTGTEFNVQDGEIRILPPDATDTQTAVLITPETGLVGFPTKTKDGVTFKSLLNPNLKPGRAVKLESKQFQGEFGAKSDKKASQSLSDSGAIIKVRKVVFDGDTEEGSWFSTVEGVPKEVQTA